MKKAKKKKKIPCVFCKGHIGPFHLKQVCFTHLKQIMVSGEEFHMSERDGMIILRSHLEVILDNIVSKNSDE